MITVFGSINMDLIAHVGRLPKPGETLAGRTFSTAAGGKGANQALAASRAGASVTMAGAVGDDAFAEGALRLLKEDRVDLSRVKTAPGATGTASILVDDDGENVIVVVAAANGQVTADDARAAVGAMQPGDVLLLQLEVPPEAVEAALLAARDRGVTSLLNVAPLTEDAARLAPLADIVIANESEFALLHPGDFPDRAALQAGMREFAGKARTVVVTLGAAGVIAVRQDNHHEAKGLAIEPVDTVGAGDTFCGYLAAELEAKRDFTQALQRAAAAGSLACLKRGAQPSIPMAIEVDAAMAQPHF